MPEVIGEVVEPRDFKLPTHENIYYLSGVDASRAGGIMFLSGNKVWFHNGTNVVLVTSG